MQYTAWEELIKHKFRLTGIIPKKKYMIHREIDKQAHFEEFG